jgi:hypothetical protein
MTIQTTSDEYQFLLEVARLEAEGRTLGDVAAHFGINAGTLTYRLARVGFTSRRQSLVVDARSGERLSDLLERGEIVPAPAREEEPALV